MPENKQSGTEGTSKTGGGGDPVVCPTEEDQEKLTETDSETAGGRGDEEADVR